jgi:hypothetical protein
MIQTYVWPLIGMIFALGVIFIVVGIYMRLNNKEMVFTTGALFITGILFIIMSIVKIFISI